MIRELHLLHHTHTDLGYTDLPSTCRRHHQEAIVQALDACDATAAAADDARFRWTCEVIAPVEELLQARPELEPRLLAAITRGQIEVGWMPWTVSPVVTGPEWQVIRARWRDLRQRLGVRTMIQNDTNGLPWGMIPGLLDEGVTAVCMGPNLYSSGGQPIALPGAFWWEGPDGRRMLVHDGLHYCTGFDFFHAAPWRRGPVPALDNVWYHAPGPLDTWIATPEGLARARARLEQTLPDRLGAYPYSVAGLQVTNHWRMDNDQPSPHLATFVAAWNAAGFTPRLRLSTFGQFIDRLRPELASAPVLRGDWVDWWSDGFPASAGEVAEAQRGKRLLADAPRTADLLGTVLPDATAAWDPLLQCSEHTWGSYDSIARPWSASALGQAAQLDDLAYRGHEEARLLRATLLRSAPAFVPTAQASAAVVVNPGTTVRAGWIELPAPALRQPVTALRHPDGQLMPLETVVGPEWCHPQPTNADDQYNDPPDLWGMQPLTLRAWSGPLAPGVHTFAYTQTTESGATPTAADLTGSGHGWRWRWDVARGGLASLIDEVSGCELVRTGDWLPGELLVETVDGFAPRNALLGRDQSLVASRLRRTVPQLVSCTPLPVHHGTAVRLIRMHPLARHIEQTWRLLPGRRIEIETDVWLIETTTPAAWLLPLPLGPDDAVASYDSLGQDTRLREDQIAGSCGEYAAVGDGVRLRGARLAVGLDCRDTPLLTFGGPATRSRRLAGEQSAVQPLLACLTATWWRDNFPIQRGRRLRLRHVVQLAAPDTDPLPLANDGLWAFPAMAPRSIIPVDGSGCSVNPQ